MDKKILILGLLLLVLVLTPLGARAQENSYQLEDGTYIHYDGLVPCGKQVWHRESPESQNYSAVHVPCQFCHLFVMLSGIISFLLTSLVPIIAVILLVAGGIMYYLSLGNPEKISKANKMLQGTIIGLIIIYGAWMAVGVLLTVLGVADWTGLQDGWYTVDCPIKAEFAILDEDETTPDTPSEETYSLTVTFTPDSCMSRLQTDPEGIDCGFVVDALPLSPLNDCQADFPANQRVYFTIETFSFCDSVDWGGLPLERSSGRRYIIMDSDKRILIAVSGLP